MKQEIKYLSMHMEKHEKRQGNLESKFQELKINYDNFSSNTDMHYNMILGFVRGSQYARFFQVSLYPW